MYNTIGNAVFHNKLAFNIQKVCKFYQRCINFWPASYLSGNNHTYQKENKHNCFDSNSLLSNDLTSQRFYLAQRGAGRFTKSWFRNSRNRSYDIVDIGEIGPPRLLFDHIPRPDYAITGIANEPENEIEVKNEAQIIGMRKSCSLAKKILDEVAKHVQIGVTTDDLDGIVHTLCNSFGAYPSPLNYRGFPKSVCTSVNNIACHGIPNNRQLKDGDIISIDVSVFYNGYHGDCAATYSVGGVDAKGEYLMNVAYLCLNKAIDVCFSGQTFCEIGKTISAIAQKHGCSVVPAFCGHGIGSYFHGPPNIYHFENEDKTVMLEGMTFTIEPVISEGRPDIVVLEDGWTASTEDYSRCAQFEHTVLITKSGAEILTVSDEFK